MRTALPAPCSAIRSGRVAIDVSDGSGTPGRYPERRSASRRGVSEGTRTPDRRDHNPELYQLSYAHRASPI
jgi:hypothetical protein